MDNMKILLTGAAGFIGQNILNYLLKCHRNFDLTVLEHFNENSKLIELSKYPQIKVLSTLHDDFTEKDFDLVLHQGAISKTTEENAENLFSQNVKSSLKIAAYCEAKKIPMIYASSASVYGKNGDRTVQFALPPEPLNGYGASKLMVDHSIVQLFPSLKFFALRYFNVYGPLEHNKGAMASPVTKFYEEARKTGQITLFKEKLDPDRPLFSRDFVFVGDVCELVFHLMENHTSLPSLTLDVGTGQPTSFHDIAQMIANTMRGEVKIVKIPMPENIERHYQSYTRANLREYHEYNLPIPSTSVDVGIAATLENYSR